MKKMTSVEKAYSIGWVVIVFSIPLTWFLVNGGSGFSRVGAWVVVIALCVESYILPKLKAYEQYLNRRVYEFNEELHNNGVELKGGALADLIEGVDDEILKPKSNSAQLHVLVMIILGTIVWGFGDLLYCHIYDILL